MSVRTDTSAVADAVPHPGNPDTYVVVPMFNEAQVIAGVVSSLRSSFANVVCVDDGSSDQSALLASAAGATVVRHPINLGQGAALRTGIEYVLRQSTVAFVVTFDADGQHRVVDALAMLDVARTGEYDVVLGSRFLMERAEVPFARRQLLRAAVRFTRITSGLPLTDAHNGLRIFNREAAQRMRIQIDGMAHASEILHLIAKHRLRYVESPVSVLYTPYSRRKGQSSINAFNIVFDLFLNRVRLAE